MTKDNEMIKRSEASSLKPTKYYPLVDATLDCCQMIESIADFVACKFDIIDGFLKTCDEVGVDTEGFEESLVGGNVDSNLRKTLLDWVTDAIAIVPGRTKIVQDMNGNDIEVPDARSKPKKAFELTESQCENILKYAGIIKATRPTPQMKYIINNKDKIDKDKFIKMMNFLFDNMYKCYSNEDRLKAKAFLSHAMVNTKRLLCGLSDEYQQMFGLWSTSKGTGKDVLMKSLIRGLTGDDVTSYKMQDLIRNFNLTLARTKGMFYIEELSNVESSKKNEIKSMITQKMIPIEQKGKEVQEIPRKFTICVTANEDPSRVFNDENKERRAGFARIIGTNYFYKTSEETNKEYLLAPYFAWMWLYCPIEYWYNPADTKELAEQDSDRTISMGMDIMEKLEEISKAKVVLDKVNKNCAENILKGEKFSRKRLETLFKGTVFQGWEIGKFLGSDYVKPLAQGKFKINRDYYESVKSSGETASVMEEYKTPSVVVDVDALVKTIQEGLDYKFPTPKFVKCEEVKRVLDFGFGECGAILKDDSKGHLELVPNRLQSRSKCITLDNNIT